VSSSQCDFLFKLEVAVRELHERLHHAASPAVMARALRFGAWLNVEMLPTDVERVFSHQSCLACVLGKTTETPEYEFGEAVYLGFKVVNPVRMNCGRYECPSYRGDLESQFRRV
jgi:hypothetical protein